jgi:hypothetical protein
MVWGVKKGRGVVFRIQGYLAHRKLTDFVYHPTLGLRVIKKRRRSRHALLVFVGVPRPSEQGYLVRNRLPGGPYSRAMPRALWWS